MARIEKFEVGQRFFQALLYRDGRDLDGDDSVGDYFTTRDEAEADGVQLVTKWHQLHPDETAIASVVRECEVTSVYGETPGYVPVHGF